MLAILISYSYCRCPIPIEHVPSSAGEIYAPSLHHMCTCLMACVHLSLQVTYMLWAC
jgi:hypothetical protein